LLFAGVLPSLAAGACGGRVEEDSPQDGGAGFAGAFGSGGVVGVGGVASGGALPTGGTTTGGAAGSGGLPSGGSGGVATGGDSSTGGSAGAQGGVGVPGTACANPGAVACAGYAQDLLAKCEGGTWHEYATCQSGDLCDTGTGKCAVVVPECAMIGPNAIICADDMSLYACGPDLVTQYLVEVCSHCGDFPTPYCFCPPGTLSNNAEMTSCSPCPDGTYSDHDDVMACSPWNDCTGQLVTSPGKATDNAVCGDPYFGVGAEVNGVNGLAATSVGGAVLVGTINVGPDASNAFIQVRDDAGEVDWMQEFSTLSVDAAMAVAVDASDSAYVVGFTRGEFEGTSAGGGDAFLRKYDALGGDEWTRQFGGAGDDGAHAVTVDTLGFVYVAGYVDSHSDEDVAPGDVLLRKYDADGNQEWARDFGTATIDQALGLAVAPSGNVYVTGFTLGHLGGTNGGEGDAFVHKSSANGVVQWIRQFGGPGYQFAHAVAVAADEAVYVVVRDVALPPSVIRYDANGNEEWSVTIGASADDLATVLSLDVNGDFYVAGHTYDRLGTAAVGSMDAFVRKYDSLGEEQWTRILDLGGADGFVALAAGAVGSASFAFLAGSTDVLVPGGGSGFFLEVWPP
jgi:hypothetical protein